ncbi:BspA family leucine-rich repeat surface protein [Parapedobacter pyrenivorans]|nr:BspA family leucine-rich repeat surface protein [Parapedobacter pyrenivorans]
MERFLPRLRMPSIRLWATLMFVLVSLVTFAQDAFITTWKTDNPGESITIPVSPDVTGYSYTVDWGDGNTSPGQTGDAIHSYTTAGTFTVTITGNFPAIKLGAHGIDVTHKLMSIEQWGDMAWTSMEGAFSGARYMVSNATDVPDLSGVSSLSRMFDGAEAFNGDLSGWDVSAVTDMASMFYNAFAFNGNITGWDVSNVTNMRGMFWQASVFNQDIGGWNVGKVEDMSYMFYQAPVFNQDLSGWDVSSVTTMNSMFFIALDFDQSLGSWDISNVTDMDDMLLSTGLSSANYGATLIGWAGLSTVPSNVTLDATGQEYCPATAAANARQQLIDKGWTIIGDTEATDCGGGVGPADPNHFVTVWKTDIDGGTGPDQIKIPAVGEFTYTWVDTNNPAATGAGSGTDETIVTFPQSGSYEVRIVPTGSTPFHAIQLYYNFAGNDASKLLEVKSWGTIHWSRFVFYGCDNLKITATDIPDLAGVTDLSFTFSKSGIESIPNINEWDVSTVTNLSNLFEDVTGFNQSLDNWDVSNVTSLNFLFDGASSFNQPLDTWDVSSVTNFDYLFRDASSFDQSLDAWNLESFVGSVGVFFQSGMSCENYSYTLYGWATNPNTKADAIFHPWSPMEYSPDVVPYRDFLINDLGWDITGDALGTCSITLPGTPIAPDADNILYVDINVNTMATGYTGAGDSWENAIPQLADALKWAREQHDGGSPGWTETEPLRIFVAKGTYLPLYHAADAQYTTDGGRDNSFVLVPNVQLYGGFDPIAGIESLEDARSLPDMNSPEQGTILSGDFNGNDNTTNYDNHTENAHHVTIVSGNVGSALMDGFTVTGGYATGNTSGSSVMGRTVYRFFGGGTYLVSSSPQLTHIVWSNNLGEWGGGLYNTTSLSTEIGSPELSNVTFYRNMAPGGGGGIRNFVGSVDIKQAIFAHNGAGLVEDGTSSGPGGGIYSSGNGTSLSVTNATFYRNWIVGVFIPHFDGGAIQVEQTSTLLNNVVIWGNEVEGDPTDPSASISISLGGDVTVANSLVAHLGGSANWNNAIGILDGGNNIDVDPVFVSTTPGDAGYLQLSACSPAISTGSNPAYIDAGGDLADDLDMGGNPRVYDFAGDGVIDMGAYEYQGERLFVQSLVVPDAVPVAYGTALEDVGGLPTSVTATLSDDTDVSIPLDGNLANWTLAGPAGGAYDGDMAGTYVFAVPLSIPETECYLNPENLQAKVIIVVAKGMPVLTASWNGASIDVDEGLSLTYGDIGELLVSFTDANGELTYAFGHDDAPPLDLTNLSAVAAQQAGTATLTIAQEETDNFEATAIEIAVTVAEQPITIVAITNQGKVYGADEPAAYGYALAEGDVLAFDDGLTDIVSAASREEGEDVGAYDIELTFGGDQADNYAITFEVDNNAFVVIPLEITVIATDEAKVFGEDDPVLTYTFMPELIGDDAFTGELGREEGENVGAYTITRGDLSLSTNYDITFEAGALTITPAEYDGVEFNNGSFVYDGTEHLLELTGELPEGATAAYEIDGEPGNGASEAGTYVVKAIVDGGENYTDMELTATLSIAPLEIMVTAADKTKVFGTDDPVLTYTFSPELAGDDAFAGALTRESGEEVGSYAITAGNLTAGDNYSIAFEAGTLTITRDGYEDIRLNDLSSTYDGTEHTLTLTGDLPGGASVAYEIDGEPGNGAIDAGTYEVTALIDGGNNYEYLTLSATLTISPLGITVMATDKAKVLGTEDPVLTYTTSPELVGDDTFRGSLTREDGEDVGDYAILQGALTAGDNYAISFLRGTFTIKPRVSRPITGIDFDDGMFPYDGTAHRLTIKGKLPEGVSLVYTNNDRTDVGSQQVIATMRGDGYETLVLTATLGVIRAERTLDFPVLPEKTYGDADFDAAAMASSREVISYTSSNPDVAEVTVDGGITITGAGETTITASVPENANYNSRPQESRILTVNKAQQVITLTAPTEVDRDAGTVEVIATSSSGLPVELSVDDIEVASLSGAALNIRRLGTVRITATQDGDANHEAAEPVQVTIRVVDPSSDLPIRVHPVISPNGDGINEFLMIEAIQDYPENRVTIFNRNGTLLWEASGYDNNRMAFRGISTSQLLLPAGTYFYLVEVRDGNTWKHEKGWFVLRY